MSVVSNIIFFKIEFDFSKCHYSDCDYLHCVEELEDKGITVSKTINNNLNIHILNSFNLKGIVYQQLTFGPKNLTRSD